MLRLLYFSTAQAGLGTSDVDGIVAKAQEKNSSMGITGALAFNGRNFCQVLEGEETTVRGLVMEIQGDPRHSGFKVLDERQVSERHFPDWSMRRVDDLDFSVVINAMSD